MIDISLKTIKDASSIHSDGNSVLVFSKNLWIFRTDGSFLIRHKTIRYPHKAVFLPNNTILVEGGSTYYYIDLADGTILWDSPHKKGRSPSASDFAVSPDRTVVYDLLRINSTVYQIERICPQTQTHDSFLLKDGLRVTEDFYCVEKDQLYFLQSQAVDTPVLSQNYQPIAQNGILVVSCSKEGLQQKWKTLWQTPVRSTNWPCNISEKHVLHDDFSVLDIDTMKCFSLLPNHDLQKYGFNRIWYPVFYEDRNLLAVCLSRTGVNVIIDCIEKKVVAQYLGKCAGCLIGKEFWIGTDEGVVRKPFPLFEEIILEK